MRTPLVAAALAAFTIAPIQAQAVYGGPSERECSTVFVFDDSFNALAGASISYGAPMWSDTVAKAVEDPRAGKYRLGKDWWSTFSTVTELTINDTKVPAGSYVLGLELDDKQGFHVLFIEAGAAMRNKWMPFAPDQWKNEIKVPMKFAKDSLEEMQKTLELEITADKQSPSDGEFSIRWGKHALTSKVRFGGNKAAEASAEKEHKGERKGEHKGERKNKGEHKGERKTKREHK